MFGQVGALVCTAANALDRFAASPGFAESLRIFFARPGGFELDAGQRAEPMSEQTTGARRASHHRHDARARRYVRRDAIRRNALSLVRPSPARAASPDAKVWLPLDGLAALPALDELLERNVAPNSRTHTVSRSAHDVNTAPAGRALPDVHPSPARARPHDPDSWFPLAALEELLAPDRLVDSGQTRAVAPENEPVLRAPAVDSPDVVDVVDPVDLELLWELQPVPHPKPVSDLQPAAEPERAPRSLMVPEPRSVPEFGRVPQAMPSPVPLRAAARPTRTRPHRDPSSARPSPSAGRDDRGDRGRRRCARRAPVPRDCHGNRRNDASRHRVDDVDARWEPSVVVHGRRRSATRARTRTRTRGAIDFAARGRSCRSDPGCSRTGAAAEEACSRATTHGCDAAHR